MSQWSDFVDHARTRGSVIEEVIKDFYSNLLVHGDNALDGGAHAGYHTIPLAHAVGPGRVIAVDANHLILEKLQPKLINLPSVVVELGALQADEARTEITFHRSSAHPGRSGISRSWDLISPGTVVYDAPLTVPATTIDKLVRRHALGSLRFIKLDLEGGEYHALRGASKTLGGMRPVVVSEHSVHSPKINGFAMEDYFAMLASHGYEAVRPDGEPVTIAQPFPFWYVFLLPSEQAPRLRPRLRESFGRAKIG